jgi:hypothetical protein
MPEFVQMKRRLGGVLPFAAGVSGIDERKASLISQPGDGATSHDFGSCSTIPPYGLKVY